VTRPPPGRRTASTAIAGRRWAPPWTCPRRLTIRVRGPRTVRAVSTPHGPSTPNGPPPPPAAAVRSDGPARNTAATVVAATGALLLLAAAVTFLAVSWDQLGLTARVAAVGSGTAAAIVGGARLRRSLPAVGAVVFHLGALLLPVDALGLALQLDASLAATWTAVGLVTLTTLPVAAHVGRSRVLAVAALTGVPILATGIGLAGGPPAPLLTAVGAVAALALVRIRHPRTSGDDQGASGDDEAGLAAVLPWAAPAIAVAAVVGPLLVAVASELAIATRGGPLLLAADAGWLPTTWSAAATSGAVAVAVVAAAAALRRSVVLAGAVPILVALAAVGLLLPGDAPASRSCCRGRCCSSPSRPRPSRSVETVPSPARVGPPRP
jgi:hypothetical protein